MKWMSFFLPIVMASLFLSMTSCDKAKEVFQTSVDKLKELKADSGGGDAELVKEVTSVDATEGKKILQTESRLVVLEFYSDT